MEKNLENKEALEKFTKLVKEINICMFITNNSEEAHTRPMATIEVEEDGTLWFFTDVRSVKVDEVAKEHDVHLAYAHPGKDSYLDVWGVAGLVTDKQTIEDKWSAEVKPWFPNGPEDPNVALLRVTPYNMYYWDAETGKMVKFLKMAASVITGQPLADGAQGSLSI